MNGRSYPRTGAAAPVFPLLLVPRQLGTRCGAAPRAFGPAPHRLNAHGRASRARRAAPALAALLAACASNPPPRDDPPPLPPPAPASRPAPDEELIEVPKPGSRHAPIAAWREAIPEELAAHDGARWLLQQKDYVKSPSGRNAWHTRYARSATEVLSVVALELESPAAARAGVADSRARIGVRGVERPIDLALAVAGAVAGASEKPGGGRRVDALAAVAVDNYLIVFDRALEGPAAPADAASVAPIDIATVRAFVEAVLPRKLPPPSVPPASKPAPGALPPPTPGAGGR